MALVSEKGPTVQNNGTISAQRWHQLTACFQTCSVFPIRLGISFGSLQEWECFDPNTGKDLGYEIREYFIPDFSNWKNHDAYQKAFRKLLQGLQDEKTAGTSA